MSDDELLSMMRGEGMTQWEMIDRIAALESAVKAAEEMADDLAIASLPDDPDESALCLVCGDRPGHTDDCTRARFYAALLETKR